RRKMRCMMPPKSRTLFQEMNRILVRKRASARAMAPYETRHHMEYCIKALCNADVTQGFKIGRDVSLPEAYVRSVRDPQRDLGGKPPHQ
ncbi:hypothetical protein glysoja_002726, partial [Glycine soja]